MADNLIRVMGLHALAYCERLYFLEEVEEIRVADERVYAGRREHLELAEDESVTELVMESESLGLRGKVDAVRSRDGSTYPVEHKRGRCMRGRDKEPRAWPSDRLQAIAYALLLREHLGEPVTEARIRYHRDNVTVRVPIDEGASTELARWVARGRDLATTTERPPVTSEEARCVRCSLAPVCLPEEGRLAAPEAIEEAREAVRLYPPDYESRSLHVTTQGARVGRSDRTFSVATPDDQKQSVGSREVSDIVLHGFAQITTQALRLAADEGIPVHFVTTSGGYVGTFSGSPGSPQRRVRQFQALSDPAFSLSLARRLVLAKVELQLRHLLRASRKEGDLRSRIEQPMADMRASLHSIARAPEASSLLGLEGIAARAYFSALPMLIVDEAGEGMRPQGRSRRPPRDRFNALLSFGYGLLYRDVVSAILRVGLEAGLGFYHTLRSSAPPLALDLVELFRVALVDLTVVAAVNRRTFDPGTDFAVTGPQVWLSEPGRKKLIEVYERRKHEEYHHEVVGYTLSYARMIELETRLLEKEWSGEPGLFARFRFR